MSTTEAKRLTFDHVTRSLVASPRARMLGCLMTSSGILRLLASVKEVQYRCHCNFEALGHGIHSIKAQHGLHPEVSRRRAIYDFRSGITPVARSKAC